MLTLSPQKKKKGFYHFSEVFYIWDIWDLASFHPSHVILYSFSWLGSLFFPSNFSCACLQTTCSVMFYFLYMWKECEGGCWCVCTSKRVCAFWGQTRHSSSGPVHLMLMFYFEMGSLTGLGLTQVAWPVSPRDQPVSVPTISLFYRSQLFLISGPPSWKCFDNWLTYFYDYLFVLERVG